MSVTLNVNGVNYTFPQKGESPNSQPAVDWGNTVTLWATAVTAGMLQKAGGSFALTAEIDFGVSFGIKSVYYKSRTTSLATAGQIRLARADVISYRNQADSANLDLGPNASNILAFNAIELVNLSASQALTNKTIDSDLNAITNIVNADIKGSAAIALSKLATLGIDNLVVTDDLGVMSSGPFAATGDIVYQSVAGPERLAIGANGLVLKVTAGLPSWGSVAGTGDVIGPGSSTDNTLARYDGATGKLLQVSGILVDDPGSINFPAEVVGNRQSLQVAIGVQAAVNGTTYCGLKDFAADGRTTLQGVGRAGGVVGINLLCNLYYVSGSGNSVECTVTIRKNGSDWLTFSMSTQTTAGKYNTHSEYVRNTQTFAASDSFDIKVVNANQTGVGAASHTFSVTMEVQYGT